MILNEEMFVDTCAWYDYFIPGGKHTAAYQAIMDAPGVRLVTSDFILDELFTLLKTRERFVANGTIWAAFKRNDFARVLQTTAIDLDSAYAIYSKFSDKEWSFTDCLSYHYIRKRKIRTALSIDHHFHEFGIATVLP